MAEPTEDLKGFVCPETGKQCHAASYAACKRFWQCLRQAQDQKHREAKGQKP